MPRSRRKLAAIVSADVVGDPRRAVPAPPLQVRLLGEIEVVRGERRLPLPQSKKTRALLAYLVVTQRPQRRDRLCGMLWDVADDPRAALRWSLSKLRPLVDEPGAPRLVTDGSTVAFAAAGARVDLFALRDQLHADGGASLDTQQLTALAAEFRGPLLEGLELPDFLEFQSWCIAAREEARALHARLLSTLVERLEAEPNAALPYARSLAQVDPFNEAAHATLARLLAACGRRGEAEQHVQAARRLLRAVDGGGALLERAAGDLPAATVPPPVAEPPRLPPPVAALVGRRREWRCLLDGLDACGAQRSLRAALLLGEPGIGKTRLLNELMAEVARRGGSVLDGAAYEAESSRPYGPWIDALRRVPAVAIGDQLGRELAPLLPELGRAAASPESRDGLFGAVAELLAARAHSAPPVLLAFDDMQWCDAASAELLHYLARMNRHRPMLIALAARDGELQDNEAMQRALRGLRHDGALEEIAVAPLDAAETAALVGGAAAAGLDVARVFAESAGNPLFALEVARSLPHRQDDVPVTLRRLVRDRVERLSGDAADVLRWGAVIGHAFDIDRLAGLCALDEGRLLAALEALERHALLTAVAAPAAGVGLHAFAHDVVRQVVYADLSEPRRRLMHQHIVRVLQAGGEPDETTAADLAHHAALAGDAETAARACLRAAQRCLRLFASAEADALARRGAHYAQALRDP
ncbi:MAG TPA: AAA family ATPase, partial [Candidatus Dormibacteraeota bacterium]|nr:AAA family ATPase [Candidatus Dormibacteraeota bacterium]